jgi:hypothetical protein
LVIPLRAFLQEEGANGCRLEMLAHHRGGVLTISRMGRPALSVLMLHQHL